MKLLLRTLIIFCEYARARSTSDGRYSFSLSSFNPDGRIGQVERAGQAASQGTPIAAVVSEDALYMAAPQLLPSPLIRDDGTPRFVQVTSEVMVAHSGLSADGRVLAAAAQRLAIEHEYTFDEDIRIEIFLEELALLMQEYTMKVGTRPFGCVLVVGYVPSPTTTLTGGQKKPMLYRVDPSGSVEMLGSYAIVNANGLDVDGALKTTMEQRLSRNCDSDDYCHQLASSFQDAVAKAFARDRASSSDNHCTMLTATLLRSVEGKEKEQPAVIVQRHDAR